MCIRDSCESGALDLVLATEPAPGPDGESLARLPLVWIGAPGGRAWRSRPLPVATVPGCAFSRATIETLAAAGFDWRIAIEASKIAVDGSVAADMAVFMMLRGTIPAGLEEIDHGGALHVALHLTPGPRRRLAELLAGDLRQAYGVPGAIAAE